MQTNFESKGNIKITASAQGLKAASVSVSVTAGAPVPFVSGGEAPLSYIQNWRVSPRSIQRPDPLQLLAENKAGIEGNVVIEAKNELVCSWK